MNEKRKRPKYTKEFRQDAVKLVTEQGYSSNEAGRRLEISQSNISRWVREYRRDQEDMAFRQGVEPAEFLCRGLVSDGERRIRTVGDRSPNAVDLAGLKTGAFEEPLAEDDVVGEQSGAHLKPPLHGYELFRRFLTPLTRTHQPDVIFRYRFGMPGKHTIKLPHDYRVRNDCSL